MQVRGGGSDDSVLTALETAASEVEKVARMLSSRTPQDWEAIGRFLARIRQVRRRMRTAMQRLCEVLAQQDFYAVKTRWRKEGKHVCRHGVFFDAAAPSRACPCLSSSCTADWSDAVLMPVLSSSLKCIVTDTFDSHTFQRLGCTQAEVRRRGW